MTPKPLSEWADQQGIPRRTAYNWANQGKLPVPFRRTLTGRIVVLDDDESTIDAHPFVAAYAEMLGGPGRHAIDNRADWLHHSPILEAWGVSLYDAVVADLRPLVLQLAIPAAVSRTKADVPARLSDWLNRIELTAWLHDTGFADVAALVAQLPEITGPDDFFDAWLTLPRQFDRHGQVMELTTATAKARGADWEAGAGAAAGLAEMGVGALESIPIAGRRESLRFALASLAHPDGDVNGRHALPLPDQSELWGLRGVYGDAAWPIGRPEAYRTAVTACHLAGWDPDAAPPPDSHRLYEIGYPATQRAARVAIAPYVHRALLREIDAFRRIALGLPFIPDHP
ncbi:hypothetical protein [Hamadaea tsunoensis]|uniref:hypothetical protein n=1 Tax=Hamadaea tsunoensis TaxID=53368 RepID=UPI0004832DE0|nr:hypothetical protein [Hamadaea tsunoensis]